MQSISEDDEMKMDAERPDGSGDNLDDDDLEERIAKLVAVGMAATANRIPQSSAPQPPEIKDDTNNNNNDGPNQSPQKRSNRNLSVFSQQFDFDGNGSLDKVEQSVRDLFRRGGGQAPSKQDVYNLAKEQSFAKREARLFKKMTLVFGGMSIFLIAATFGLVFVAVKITKEAKVNNDGMMIATRGSKYPVATLGSGGVGHVTFDGDKFGDTEIIYGVEETYVASVPKADVEAIFRERMAGVSSVSTDVDYNDGVLHTWDVHGDIDHWVDGDRMVYLNVEASYFPQSSFTVICYESSSLCGVYQRNHDGATIRETTLHRGTAAGGGGARFRPPSSASRRHRGLREEEGDGVDDYMKNTGTSDGTSKHRRRLEFTESVFKDLSIECWLSEYDLSLVVYESHFFVYAEPGNNDVLSSSSSSSSTTRTATDAPSCPTFTLDVEYEKGKEAVKKVTFLTDEGVAELSHVEKYRLNDHRVPMKELAVSAKNARITKSSTQEGEEGYENQEVEMDDEGISVLSYNGFHNNCATFILDVLSGVDIEVDDGAIDYSARSLVGGELATRLLDGESSKSVGGALSRRLFGDEAVVRMVVSNYVKAHQNEERDDL